MFKIALDYWNYFVPDVYTTLSTGLADANAAFAFGGPPAGGGGAAGAAKGRKQLYSPVLSSLRLLIISRMAKPEEVRARGPFPGWAHCSLACRVLLARWLPPSQQVRMVDCDPWPWLFLQLLLEDCV